MKLSKQLPLFTLFSAICLSEITCLAGTLNENERQIYIVYMGELPKNKIPLTSLYHSILSEAIGDETLARNSIIHSYIRSFNGFAARLLPHEAQLLSQKEGVVSVFPNRVHKLLTTRSWDFLGLTEKAKRNHQIESNIIVAVLDSGIWVENPSFDDRGFGPPPQKWKGKCDKAANFTGCNNKVIGAQYFNLSGIVPPEEATPLDYDGHGTHTASTVAGIAVKGASLYGIAEGTARGGVPSARIASYKVCWGGYCLDADILAAFDAAIADGVDIISVSLGAGVRNFTSDSIAIGAFHAMNNGILTICAAGNDGPALGTVKNVAPWILTVAASTIDRKFVTNVKLGNGEIISGNGINTYEPKKEFDPLTNGELAKNSSGDFVGNASACESGTLNKDKIKGQVVYCQGTGGDHVITELGGAAGTIMSEDRFEDTPFITNGPGTYLTLGVGQRIDKYINSTRSPRAVINKTTTVKTVAPAIASFSSRGPQPLPYNILKPDISAPGDGILAGYTIFTSLTGDDTDTRVAKYSVLSGTSMSTPHVAAAAAYVKTFHPKWSPAAIKSALMTTSTSVKIKPVGAELASGSGQINPIAALDPGLVYDIDTISYISLLCKEGYKSQDIALLTGNKSYNCSNVPQARGADGLNYPSIHLQLKNNESIISGVFYRTVTNVGHHNARYKAKVISPKNLSVKVIPNILKFCQWKEKKSFKVILNGKLHQKESNWFISGSLVWSDSKHHVRSPILISPQLAIDQHIV